MRADRIALLLPEVYRRTIVPGTPLASLIDVMEQLHAPVETVLAELPMYFDPQRTPDRFVPFLARWVDLDRWMDEGSDTFDSGVGRLRQVVAAAARLSRLRGTAEGLRDALELAIGVAGVGIEEGLDAAGKTRPYHAVVTLPAEAAAHDMLVRRIVAQEKPAHVTVDVVYANGAPPPPAEEDVPPVPPLPTLPVADEQSGEPAFPGTERIPVMTGVPEVPDAPAPAVPPVPEPVAPPAPPASAPPSSPPPVE